MSFCIITKDGSVVGYKNGDNETALLKPVPIELLNSDVALLKALVDNKNNSTKFVELMNTLQSKSASPQTRQTSSLPSNSEVQSSLDTESYSLTPIQQLKYVLTDHNIDFNSLSPTTQREIENELNNNPDLLNNTEFIQAIKCL